MLKDRQVKSLKKLKRSGLNNDVGWAGSKSPWTFKILDKQDLPEDLFSLYSQACHPVLPRLLDIKEGDTTFYILKENIHGESLEAMIHREGRIEPGKASRIIVAICDALDYLQILLPCILCYNDIALSDIVLDKQDAVKLVNLEHLIQAKSNRESTEIQKRHQVQSVALLYYHLLTGKNPCRDISNLKSFSQLGVYLPGELFDIVTRTLKPGMDIKSLNHLKKEIEKIFPLYHKEHQDKGGSQKKSRITTRQALKIAGITFAVSAAVMVITHLLFLEKETHETETSNMENRLTWQETTLPENEEGDPSASIVDEKEQDADSSSEDSDLLPEAFHGSSETLTDPEETAAESEPSSSQTNKNAPANKNKKVFLSAMEPAVFHAGSPDFKLSKMGSSDKDINGGKYSVGIKLELVDSYLSDFSDQWMEVEYSLTKSYSSFSCVFSLSQGNKHIDPAQKAWLNVLGDGELLLSSPSIGSDSQPVDIDVPIKGVKKLTLQINPASQFVENACFLIGDPVLEP